MGLFNKLFGKKQPTPVATETIDLKKVFPRIKGLYNSETPAASANQPSFEFSPADMPAYEPIAEGLGLFYGVDQGQNFMLLQNKHLSETVTLEKLREVAIQNLLQETAENTELKGDPSDIMMLTNGGNYETAMILVDNLWVELEGIFNDQVCIALPARDLLFIAGKNNPVGRESLRNMVNNAYDQLDTNSQLVRHIYTRENDQWVVVETV